MKVIRVLGLLLLGLICSFLLVFAPDLGSGLKAYGTGTNWLSICLLVGVAMSIAILFAELFPNGQVGVLYFSRSLSVALMAIGSVVVIVAATSILGFGQYGPEAVKSETATRMVGLLAFIAATTCLHLSVALFRYGEKPFLKQGFAA